MSGLLKKNTVLILSVVFAFIFWFFEIVDGGPSILVENIEREKDGEVTNILSTSSSESTITLDTIPKTNQINQSTTTPRVDSKGILYEVVKVVDGDTLDVLIEGKVERLRLIGINTPETVDPRKTVECFGVEASNKAKSLLTGKKIYLEKDTSQGERDKYNRLLRYVFLEDGTNFNLLMIREGYAYEYTYDVPYLYQTEFKNTQKEASIRKVGLWGTVCEKSTTEDELKNPLPTQINTAHNTCTIKGNINTNGDKIYHMIGCDSYEKTDVDESREEKWFCTEEDALASGWRRALNCN